MDNAKLEIRRAVKNGKPAVELVVRNATASLRALCDTLGIAPTVGVSNRRAIICSTPAELDAAREPLRALFDAAGN
jgi:hypothetical protein